MVQLEAIAIRKAIGVAAGRVVADSALSGTVVRDSTVAFLLTDSIVGFSYPGFHRNRWPPSLTRCDRSAAICSAGLRNADLPARTLRLGVASTQVTDV